MHRRLFLAVLATCSLAGPLSVRAEEEGGAKTKQPYLSLPAVAVSVLRPDHRRGVLTVEVGVDVRDPRLRDRIELYQPLLNSAYVSALQPYGVGLGPGELPNADYISLTFQRETDRVLGRKGAKLLLGSILMH